TDLVARYGGDEFVVLLSRADKPIAEEDAQRIPNVRFPATLECAVKMVRIKANVGAATFPDNGNALQVVVAAADRLMYKDKELRDPPKGKLIITKLDRAAASLRGRHPDEHPSRSAAGGLMADAPKRAESP